MSRTIQSMLAGLALFIGMASAAVAQQPAAPRSVTFAYGDLDVSTLQGGQALLARIQSAARKVCGDSDAHSPLHPRSETLCRRATMSTKTKALPVLSALPVAYWVNGDTGLKQTSEAAWGGVGVLLGVRDRRLAAQQGTAGDSVRLFIRAASAFASPHGGAARATFWNRC